MAVRKQSEILGSGLDMEADELDPLRMAGVGMKLGWINSTSAV
jgi:hypothetical protein